MGDMRSLDLDEQADREDAVGTRSDAENHPGIRPGAGLPRRRALAMLAMAASAAAATRRDDLPISVDDRGTPHRLRASMPPLDPPLSGGAISEIVRKVRLRDDMVFSDLVHWLRVFSERPGFPGAGAPLDRVLDEVTDARRLASRFGGPSCLVRTDHGARYLFAPASSPGAGPGKGLHAYQALATFAEVGVGLGRKLSFRTGEGTVAGLVRDLMANFQTRGVAGIEPEWAAMALWLYVPPGRSWRNRWGDTLDLPAVAEYVADAPRGGAACEGIHALIALSVARQVDRANPVLSRAASARIAGRLGAATRVLGASQAADGSWSEGWDGKPAGGIRGTGDAVHITGHLLEWQSLLPAEERAPRACIERALRFLAEVTLEASDEEVAQLYCPFSHAARVVLQASRLGDRPRVAALARAAHRGVVHAGSPGAG